MRRVASPAPLAKTKLATIALLAMVAVALGGGCSGKAEETSLDAGAPGAREPDAGAPEASLEDGASGLDGSHTTSSVPLSHRPDDSQCLAAPAAGTCPATNTVGPCATDGDCADAGPNGRCDVSLHGAVGSSANCACTWDACRSDSDCASGSLCVCHGSNGWIGGNECLPGNCRVDADCGTGGYCSPSESAVSCGAFVGYFCHTPNDTCTNDIDCAADAMCMWSASTGSWACATIADVLCPI
jgi:hypothetical protein